ncbi:MAG: hypothetical protein AAF092_18390 [Pseudomonadota bacterium]
MLAQIEADARLPQVPPQPTVAWVCDQHLARLRELKKDGNHDPNRAAFHTLKRRLGNIRADQVTQDVVDGYAASRRGDRRWENHANAGRSTGTIAESTIQKALRMLRAALNDAHARNHILSPARFRITASSGRPRERWLTRDEVKRMLAACGGESIRDADGKVKYRARNRSHFEGFSCLSLATAARKEAVLLLTWDQIFIPDADGEALRDASTTTLSEAAKGAYIDFSEARGYKRRPRISIADNYQLMNWLIFNRPPTDDDSYSAEGLRRVITFQGEPVKDIKRSLAAVAEEAGDLASRHTSSSKRRLQDGARRYPARNCFTAHGNKHQGFGAALQPPPPGPTEGARVRTHSQ